MPKREWDIEALKRRGMVEQVLVEEEFLRDIEAGKTLTVYQGFDPTSPYLHLGHMVSLRLLRWFQMCGHHVIFLIGDFTGMIGDPTDRSAARKQLGREEVLSNASTYRQQISKVLDLEGDAAVEVRFNSVWLDKLAFKDVVELAANMTVQQLIERDMFQRRLRENEPIALHEFLYPLMQGYDAVAMQVDVEVGGRDQLFNMMVGRDLVRRYLRKAKHVVTTPLLPGLDGRKMGKTEGNTVDLVEAPVPMFFRLTLVQDSLLPTFLGALTDVDDSYIEVVRKRLSSEDNLQDVRELLAYHVVTALHGIHAAANAQEEFRRVVEEGQPPSHIPTLNVRASQVGAAGLRIVDLLALSPLVSSKGDARRLIQQGAIRLDGERVEDPFMELPLAKLAGAILKVGRRGYTKVQVDG